MPGWGDSHLNYRFREACWIRHNSGGIFLAMRLLRSLPAWAPAGSLREPHRCAPAHCVRGVVEQGAYRPPYPPAYLLSVIHLQATTCVAAFPFPRGTGVPPVVPLGPRATGPHWAILFSSSIPSVGARTRCQHDCQSLALGRRLSPALPDRNRRVPSVAHECPAGVEFSASLEHPVPCPFCRGRDCPRFGIAVVAWLHCTAQIRPPHELRAKGRTPVKTLP